MPSTRYRMSSYKGNQFFRQQLAVGCAKNFIRSHHHLQCIIPPKARELPQCIDHCDEDCCTTGGIQGGHRLEWKLSLHMCDEIKWVWTPSGVCSNECGSGAWCRNCSHGQIVNDADAFVHTAPCQPPLLSSVEHQNPPYGELDAWQVELMLINRKGSPKTFEALHRCWVDWADYLYKKVHGIQAYCATTGLRGLPLDHFPLCPHSLNPQIIYPTLRKVEFLRAKHNCMFILMPPGWNANPIPSMPSQTPAMAPSASPASCPTATNPSLHSQPLLLIPGPSVNEAIRQLGRSLVLCGAPSITAHRPVHVLPAGTEAPIQDMQLNQEVPLHTHLHNRPAH
ncbi:hypothetical protein FB451DRAFT_1162012 [Mycena latifolia]|nr:hypothetical protein FB451DRAFT_1162012 [Mycena latifolia]